MIEVVNQQRYKKIDRQAWADFARKALNVVGGGKQSATIAFVSDRKMRELNMQFRGQDRTTDVLSFPADPDDFTSSEKDHLGDVVIATKRADEQATANGLAFELEVAQLILHGLLHLTGYDHETDRGQMNRLEIRLRKKLKIEG